MQVVAESQGGIREIRGRRGSRGLRGNGGKLEGVGTFAILSNMVQHFATQRGWNH